MRYMERYGAYGLMSCHMVHDGDGSWLSVMAMVHEVRCMLGDGAWCTVHGDGAQCMVVGDGADARCIGVGCMLGEKG